jgi:hypothetical protein
MKVFLSYASEDRFHIGHSAYGPVSNCNVVQLFKNRAPKENVEN